MNNKGFTLIEMLMVVLILGMLTLLLVPTINSLIERNENDNLKFMQESIKIAAQNYASDNKFELFNTCDDNGIKVTLEQLVDEGYLSSPIKNPKTKEDISLANEVNVIYDCNTLQFIASLDFEIE